MTKIKTAGRPKGSLAKETNAVVDQIKVVFYENPDKEFTTSDIIESMGKSLLGIKNSNVRVRMWLDMLTEQNFIKYLGVTKLHGRGRPTKVYKLNK